MPSIIDGPKARTDRSYSTSVSRSLTHLHKSASQTSPSVRLISVSALFGLVPAGGSQQTAMIWHRSNQILLGARKLDDFGACEGSR